MKRRCGQSEVGVVGIVWEQVFDLGVEWPKRGLRITIQLIQLSLLEFLLGRRDIFIEVFEQVIRVRDRAKPHREVVIVTFP